MNPAAAAAIAAGNTPADRADPTVETEFAEEHHTFERRVPVSRRAAHNTATAIEMSNPLPCLGKVAGDNPSVMRRCGHGSPELRTAARTRSRDSDSAASGKPMIVKPGRPRREVGLDLDDRALHASERNRPGPRERHQNAPRRCSTDVAPDSGRKTDTTSKRTSV